MKGKKITSLLVIAVLLLTTLAIAVNVSAANDVTLVLDPDSGYVGDTVNATGTSDPYVPIEIFWDYVKIAETTADGSGEYLKEIIIPEDVVGKHTVAAKDTFHNTIGEDNFTIKPKITVTPESGLPDDTFTVAGTGFAATSDIDIFFANPAAKAQVLFAGIGTAEWVTDPGTVNVHGDVVNMTHGSGCPAASIYLNGPTLADFNANYLTTLGFSYYTTDAAGIPDIELRFVAPNCIDPDDDTSDSRGHVDLTFHELGSAIPDSWQDFTDITGTDVLYAYGNDPDDGSDLSLSQAAWNTVYGELSGLGYLDWNLTRVSVQSSTAGKSYVDNVTLDGTTYYDMEQPVEVETTDALGSFEVTLTVPDIEYATYSVSAVDDSREFFNITSFEVTATIALDPEDGASGTVVDISGIGFNGTTVDIYFDVELLKEDIALTDGTFTSSFIVPTVALDLWEIRAVDNNPTPIEAYLDFNVTATTQIILDPISTEPDSLVTIEGTGFTAIVGVEVDVDVGPLMDYLTFYTNSTGGFKETFLVPTFIPGPYDINATDENGLTAEAELTVAITELTLDPEEGPTGMVLTVDGSGFTPGSLYNVTFNDEVVVDGTASAGIVDASFTVPTVPVGFYTVKVVDTLEISGTATFEVNATTTITVDPSTALVAYEIELEGAHFSTLSEMTILLQNSTWSEPLVTVPDLFDTLDNGTFACTFAVPEVELGDYVVNATDAAGLVATTPFTVVESIYVDVSTVSPEYLPGDTVSFSIMAAFAFDIELVITDPMGYPFTTIGPIESANWVVLGDYYVVPLADATFELPSDATTGLWNFTASDDTEMVATGTFTVGETEEPEPEPETDISLSVGWNLVSLPLIPDDSSIEVVLSGLAGVESVWTYVAGVWYSYSPGVPSDLTDMVDGEGYWISMSASATLSVSGTEMPVDPFDPLPAYPVVEGWNLIGFKSTTPMTVDEYLAGVDYVRVYEFIDVYSVLSATDDMTPGRGYWMAASDPGTIYP